MVLAQREHLFNYTKKGKVQPVWTIYIVSIDWICRIWFFSNYLSINAKKGIEHLFDEYFLLACWRIKGSCTVHVPPWFWLFCEPLHRRNEVRSGDKRSCMHPGWHIWDISSLYWPCNPICNHTSGSRDTSSFFSPNKIAIALVRDANITCFWRDNYQCLGHF